MSLKIHKSSAKIVYGDIKIEFVRNPHQLITYSIKVTIGNKAIVYSSDTGFENNTLIECARSADVLICEASYIKKYQKTSDNHLYAYEAGMIAKSANVGKLLLTHFYPGVNKQDYVDEAKEKFENTEAAEEGKKLILRRN